MTGSFEAQSSPVREADARSGPLGTEDIAGEDDGREDSKSPALASHALLHAGQPVGHGVVGNSKDVLCAKGVINYMSHNVPTGLYAKKVYPPAVGVYRDLEGNDVEVFGVEVERVEVDIQSGRDQGLHLDADGVQLVPNSFMPIDYYDVDQVVARYYPECCRMVQEATGARRVFAFDHNLRSPGRRGSAAGAGFQVQPPLQLVHADYTEESAIRRIRDLTLPPTKNDIFCRVGNGAPLIGEDADELLGRRFAIVNVWRSIHPEPVERVPLGFLAPGSCSGEDIVIHEIHFKERVGENYNARHEPSHRWCYFPGMDRDEAVLLKTWDSAGQFCRWPSPGERVPATFVFHAAFEVPVREQAPDRESIEVRCIVVY